LIQFKTGQLYPRDVVVERILRVSFGKNFSVGRIITRFILKNTKTSSLLDTAEIRKNVELGLKTDSCNSF